MSTYLRQMLDEIEGKENEVGDDDEEDYTVSNI